MVTKIWLKGRTKGSEALVYQDGFPIFTIVTNTKNKELNIETINVYHSKGGKPMATWLNKDIVRVEFRPK